MSVDFAVDPEAVTTEQVRQADVWDMAEHANNEFMMKKNDFQKAGGALEGGVEGVTKVLHLGAIEPAHHPMPISGQELWPYNKHVIL